uniref:Uncharacterized protein n=1 Tax=Anguilla anguilla TaxID=7936 RepID=A0A0E9PDB3_ANGAN
MQWLLLNVLLSFVQAWKKVSRCTTSTSPGMDLKGFCNWMLLFH